MSQVGILVAYPYLTERAEAELRGEHWVLDSGAYSALNSGHTLDLSAYIDKIYALREVGLIPRHVFALDVIGDHDQSMSNAVRMREEGLEVIPTWHCGSPLSALREIAAEFPRIAFGGAVGKTETGGPRFTVRQRHGELNRMFSEVWPKWVHGFGITTEALMQAFPLASVDSTSWVTGPWRFGQWRSFGIRVPVRRNFGTVDAKAEIPFYTTLAEKHWVRWGRELRRVGQETFTIKLACQSLPELRLVHAHNERA